MHRPLNSDSSDAEKASAGVTPDDAVAIESFLAGTAGNRIDKLVRIIARASVVSSIVDSDEVIQNTRVALIEVFQNGRYVSGRLNAYVRRVTEIQLLLELRRRRNHAERVEKRTDVTRLSDGTPTIEDTMENTERLYHGRAILSRLGQLCKRILILRYYRGLSYRDIASRLSISEGAARVRVFRCLKECETIRSRMAGRL